MAQVANCPRCSHEILILDDVTPDNWARCPACRTYFQLKDVAAREILSAKLVGEQSNDVYRETIIVEDDIETVLESTNDSGELTLTPRSDATISDFSPVEATPVPDNNTEAELANAEIAPSWRDADEPSGLVPAVTYNPSPVEASAPTISSTSEKSAWSGNAETESVSEPNSQAQPDIAQPTDACRLDDSTDRLDKWFRATKSQAETSTTPPLIDRADELVESIGMTTPPIAEPIDDRPTWDDSEHMDRLLAEVDDADAETLESEVLEDAELGDDIESDAGDNVDGDTLVGPNDGPIVEQFDDAPPTAFIPPGRLPRRKKSLARTLILAALSGPVGLAIGYFILLWLAGPSIDFLNVAQYLPSVLLPAEFEPKAAIVAAAEQSTPSAAEPNDETGSNNEASKPREVQAGYRAPISQPIDGESDQTPLPFDEPAATTFTETTDAVVGRVTNAPLYSADELAVSLRAAQQAQPKLVAGDLNDGREVQRAKGYSYSLMCDLAQKFAFVDTMSRTDFVTALGADTLQLFEETLDNAHTRQEVARILPKWIGSPHRKHGGVFFAGTLVNQAAKGSVTEWQVDAEGHHTAIVLVTTPIAEKFANSAGPVAIIGWIIDNPAQHVSGYTGDVPQAVWASRLIPLQ